LRLFAAICSVSAYPVGLVGQDIESGCASGTGVHRQVRQDQRRAWSNKITHARVELGRHPKPVCNLF
jgi:putative lipase involved disintegration of autophagic bodies